METPDVCPDYLGEEAKARWYEIQGILIRKDTWSNNYVPLLEQLCLLYQYLAEIDDVISKADQNDGFSVMVPTGKGQSMGIKVNPLLEHRLDVIKQIRTFLKDFQLAPTPVRAVAEPDGPASSPEGITTKPRLMNIDEAVA